MPIGQLAPGVNPARWFRGLFYTGAAGVGVVITLGFLDLLKNNPSSASEVLRGWGPGFVLGLLALVVGGAFLDKMVDAQRSSVEAQQEVAVALTKLAERDDRDRDRMVTETQYMAQRMDQTHALVTSMAAQLERIEARLGSKNAGE